MEPEAVFGSEQPACTGEYRVQIDNGPAFNLFADPKGNAVVMISTEPPGNYVSGIDQRVANK